MLASHQHRGLPVAQVTGNVTLTMSGLLLTACLLSAVQIGLLGFLLSRLRHLERESRALSLAQQESSREVVGVSGHEEAVLDRLRRLEETVDATYRLLARPLRRELNTLGGITEELGSRRQEVELMRKGQQGALFRKLVGELVRIRRDMSESAEDPRESEQKRVVYSDVVELLDDHLGAIGAERRSPKVGSDYRKSELVADHPRVERTSDRSLDWTIAAVASGAWVVDEGTCVTVLAPAEVTVLRFEGGR